ncbi:MAG TPA: hypothetical protein PK295_04270 [Candidatus Magasanikbacteria bacterium]|nr:hypothetical protein [Candidatus Magasanikbacteria bacterium]
MNLRSATLLELLAFAAKYPNEQQEGSPIIALDGYYDHRGFHRVPYLEKSWDQLLLDFCYGTPIGGWDKCCRFLVVEMKGKS